MGGEPRTILVEGQPKRHALCQLESTEIVTSVAWAKAEESGGWPEQVWLRPASIDCPAYLGGRLRSAQHKKLIGPMPGWVTGSESETTLPCVARGYDSLRRADLVVRSMVVKYRRIQIPLSVAIPWNGYR